MAFLEDFKTSSSASNHCALKLLHRIGFDCGAIGILFQTSLFNIFRKFFSDQACATAKQFAVSGLSLYLTSFNVAGLGCKSAQRVAFLRMTVKATVVTCRVQNPACTAIKNPWEPGPCKWSKHP